LPTIPSKHGSPKAIETFGINIGAGQTKQNDINSNVPIIAAVWNSTLEFGLPGCLAEWNRTMSSES
jgi:hypothetical protein